MEKEWTCKTFRILALGDSYTVGEGLETTQSFPNEIARLLSALRRPEHKRRPCSAVTIDVVAKTGWTTDELLKGMSESDACGASCRYDLVTLLIGVNNQYRGRSSDEFVADFEALLKMALEFADGLPNRVVVLSIPDWGITPFAAKEKKDSFLIAGQIDDFNAVIYRLAKRYRMHFINVTPWTREAQSDPGLLAADGLHPSGREYTRWAEAVLKKLQDHERKTQTRVNTSLENCANCGIDGIFRPLYKLFSWA